MESDNVKRLKLQEHAEALNSHKALLEELNLDSNVRLDEIIKSFENISITLEEYLKVIGIG